MDKLIEGIAVTLQDFREDEGINISPDNIEKWVNQFDKGDRVFLLTELNSILPDRYISKADAKSFLKSVIEKLKTDLNYNSIPEFLEKTVFLDLQAPGKSQKVLLDLLSIVLEEEYQINIDEFSACPDKTNFVYIDDVLCTGNTWFYDIKNWAEADNGTFLNLLREKQINLITTFMMIHKPIVRTFFSCTWL